jgi:hypothetical protein
VLLVPTGVAVDQRGCKLVYVAYNQASYLKERGTLAENGVSFTPWARTWQKGYRGPKS